MISIDCVCFTVHVATCMSCPKYDLARKDMLDLLVETFPHIEQANNHTMFIFIMQCHDYEVTDALSKMLLYVSKERGSL